MENSHYVLVCLTGEFKGWFVNKPGRRKSYTKDLQSAQSFNTYEKAKTSACSNEYPKLVHDCI